MDSIPYAGTSSELTILATGYNNFGQLGEYSDDNGDVRRFRRLRLPPGCEAKEKIRIVHVTWTDVYVLADVHFFNLGELHETRQCLSARTAQTLAQSFGGHDALYGCVSTTGALYTFDAGSGRLLVQQSNDNSPLLSHVAIAGNGKVAIAVMQASASVLYHILQFENIDDMYGWFRDPAQIQNGNVRGRRQFSISGKPKQLVANAATWLLLTEAGQVWSWGDPRHVTLGRRTTVGAAWRPGRMELLDGLKVVKIAAGGWMGAALTDEGEAYVWGRGEPGTDATVDMVLSAGRDELPKVDITPMPDFDNSDVDSDDTIVGTAKVLDIGVGRNHLAVIIKGGWLFVCGENENGQLGLGERETQDIPHSSFVPDWICADDVGNARHVVCTARNTFVFEAPNPPPRQREPKAAVEGSNNVGSKSDQGPEKWSASNRHDG